MHQFHGMGYAEYSRKHKKRLEVEKQREKEYVISQHVVGSIERKLHSPPVDEHRLSKRM
ncbi:hypothetical protein [Bacillus kexueae]|uniref:hypothetical protein n=1 Tax=Aeribacillus kexueae TaxID=2078952 RepID=UPI00311AA9A2